MDQDDIFVSDAPTPWGAIFCLLSANLFGKVKWTPPQQAFIIGRKLVHSRKVSDFQWCHSDSCDSPWRLQKAPGEKGKILTSTWLVVESSSLVRHLPALAHEHANKLFASFFLIWWRNFRRFLKLKISLFAQIINWLEKGELFLFEGKMLCREVDCPNDCLTGFTGVTHRGKCFLRKQIENIVS